MNKNKQISINMIATLVAFVINMGINFILSPYIINTLGSEAYGFVTLANNFVNYAAVITIALNSVAGRFITIEIHRDNYYEANQYFNSVLTCNCLIGGVILIIGFILSSCLEKIINVPNNIVGDVKILFFLIILNFVISIIGTTYGVATFVRNRLDLSSIRSIIASFIKATIIIVLFILFKPKVFFVGVATISYSIYTIICNIKYTKKLTPEIIVKRTFFSVKKSVELISSGIWNTIIKLGQILTDGLDLLICNLFISTIAMGQLAVSKTMLTVFSSMLVSASSVFQPQLTYDYAKNNKSILIKEIKLSMKLTGSIANIFLAGVIAFGVMFYKLWVPNQNIDLIYKLTLLSIQGVIVSGVVHPLFNIYTLTNKLKINSIVEVISGLLNILIVFILLKTTSLGIYAVAGVSTIIAIVRNLTFTPIYSAKCLEVKSTTFYPTIIRYILTTIIMCVSFILISKTIIKLSWINLILGAVFCSVFGIIINFIFLFNKSEKESIINIVRSKVNIKRSINYE